MQLSEDPARRQLIRELEKAPRRKGKSEYIKILKGQYCTQRERILAKCYDCMGYYADGAEDCRVSSCPLYKLMPYRERGDSK
jgi:hypothetical protein